MDYLQQRAGLGLVLLWLCAPLCAQQDDPPTSAPIRALITQAESESTRDLALSVKTAQQAYEQALAAKDVQLAIDARLVWADSLLKGRKLDEADQLLTALQLQLDARPADRDHARYQVLRARWLRDQNRIDDAEKAFLQATELAARAGDEAVLANVLNSHSAMLWRHGQLDRATVNLQRALEINLRLGKENDANKNRSYLALIARDRGDFDRSKVLNEEVLNSSEALGDLRGIAVSANSIALLLVHQGEMRESLTYFQRSADAYHQVGDPAGEGPALANIGQTLIELGRIDASEKPLREALAMALSSGDPTAEVISRSGLAARALKLDRIEEAEAEATRAIQTAERLPARAPAARALSTMANIRRSQGRLSEAIALRRQSLQYAREQGRQTDIRNLLTSLAEDLASTGQHAESYQLQREITQINSHMRDLEIRRQIAAIEDQQQTKQRQAEIAAQAQRIGSLEHQAGQQQRIRYLLVATLAAALILVMMLINRVIIRRQAEQLLIERNAAIERANRDLAEAADTDILTQSRNRRHFQQRLLPMLQSAQANATAFALILIDADRFKSINDQHGHDIGDRALIAITEAWRGCLSPQDILVRWGGEEFLIVAPSAVHDSTLDLVRRGMAATRAATVDTLPSLRLSVSVGWLNGPWPGADVAALLRICDRAMLQAKAAGRDRAVGVIHREALSDAHGVTDNLEALPGVELLRTS